MNLALIISALKKHVSISQRAADFFRAHQKGKEYEEAVKVLNEATRALNDATQTLADVLSEKNEKLGGPKISKGKFQTEVDQAEFLSLIDKLTKDADEADKH